MIDFHVHQPRANAYASGEYVAVMDELGIDVSVIFTYEGLLQPTPAANDSLAAYTAPHPERYVTFATVDPRHPRASAEIERCVREHGMRGVKLHPWLQGFSAHEPGLDPVCETMARLGLPLLFHDGTPPFSTPLQLASLARRHPDAPIVLGHGGLMDFWREAIEAVTTTPNVHVCMCGTPPYAMRRIVESCPMDRLLFGTDAGLRAHPYHRYAALRIRQLERLNLTPDQLLAIVDRNPRRLLGMPET